MSREIELWAVDLLGRLPEGGPARLDSLGKKGRLSNRPNPTPRGDLPGHLHLCLQNSQVRLFIQRRESGNLSPTPVAWRQLEASLYARHECIWPSLRCSGSSVSGSKIPCGPQFQWEGRKWFKSWKMYSSIPWKQEGVSEGKRGREKLNTELKAGSCGGALLFVGRSIRLRRVQDPGLPLMRLYLYLIFYKIFLS